MKIIKNIKHDIKQVHYYGLLEAVKSQYGSDIINANHASILSDAILDKTGRRISTSTLVRLFVKSYNKHIPYLNTLDILADYAGFNNWFSFCKNHNCEPEIDISENYVSDKMGLKLFKSCLDNHEFKSVLDYLKVLNTIGISNISLHLQIGEILGNSIKNDLYAQKLLIPALAKTIEGRHLYFENYVDEDNLNSYYGDSLRIYSNYQEGVFKRHKLRNFVFINSMFFLKAYQANDIIQMRKIGYQLFSLDENEIVGQNLDAHPLSRWLSYRLIYWKYSNQLTAQKIEKTLTLLHNEIKLRAESWFTSISIEFMMEALLHLGSYQEIITLYQCHYKIINCKNVSNSVERFSNQMILIYTKIAMLKSNQKELSDDIELLNIEIALPTKNKYISYRNLLSNTELGFK